MQLLKTVRSERKYDGKIIDLVVDVVEYPSGRQTIREVVKHPGGAVIVPLLEDGTVLLVRQYRHPLASVITELPAGKLDQGEDPLNCARRELREETGYTADQLMHLSSIHTTPGVCDEILHIYLATGLTPAGSGQQLDEGEEGLSFLSLPLAEAIQMVESGAITDAKTICGLLLTARHLEQRNHERR